MSYDLVIEHRFLINPGPWADVVVNVAIFQANTNMGDAWRQFPGYDIAGKIIRPVTGDR